MSADSKPPDNEILSVELTDSSLSWDVSQLMQRLVDKLQPLHDDFLRAVDAGDPAEIFETARVFYKTYQSDADIIEASLLMHVKAENPIDFTIEDISNNISRDIVQDRIDEGVAARLVSLDLAEWLHNRLAGVLSYNDQYLLQEYHKALSELNEVKMDRFHDYSMEEAQKKLGKEPPAADAIDEEKEIYHAQVVRKYYEGRIAILEEIQGAENDELISDLIKFKLPENELSDGYEPYGYPSGYNSNILNDMIKAEEDALRDWIMRYRLDDATLMVEIKEAFEAMVEALDEDAEDYKSSDDDQYEQETNQSLDDEKYVPQASAPFSKPQF